MQSVVSVIIKVIAVFIGILVLLKLIGANPSTPFVNFIYKISDPIMAPFQNILPPLQITDILTIDISVFFVVLIFGIISAIIMKGFDFLLDMVTIKHGQGMIIGGEKVGRF